MEKALGFELMVVAIPGAWAQVPSLKLPTFGGLLSQHEQKKWVGQKCCVFLMEKKEKKVTWELNRCVGSCFFDTKQRNLRDLCGWLE